MSDCVIFDYFYMADLAHIYKNISDVFKYSQAPSKSEKTKRFGRR